MNNAKVAAALNTISLAFGELAEALTDEGVAPATARPSAIPEPFEEVVDEIFPEPQGSAAMCPKHRIPYTEGAYGPYCRSTTDEEAWGKRKGAKLWCRITPKSAAEYLRQRAAA